MTEEGTHSRIINRVQKNPKTTPTPKKQPKTHAKPQNHTWKLKSEVLQSFPESHITYNWHMAMHVNPIWTNQDGNATLAQVQLTY